MKLPLATAERKIPVSAFVLFASLAAWLMTLSFPAVGAPVRESTLEARIASCDASVVRSAIDEMLRDPKTLQEPLMLFHAASAERAVGRKEEAAFLFLAARLRTARQILFEKGDRPQLLAIMTMTVGPLIMPVLQADPKLARRVVKRVIDWDRSTPDPYRDREEAKSGEIRTQLAEIDSGFARLPDQLPDNPAGMAEAQAAGRQAELMLNASLAERCGPGTLDAIDAEAATERIKKQAEHLARTHSFVLAHAGGSIKSVNVGAWKQGAARLPGRLTVSVNPGTGKPFYAEVDAETVITADRKLGSVKFSLACVTNLWIGQRDGSWKDVCMDDPTAIRPPRMANAELRQFDLGPGAQSEKSAAQPPVCGFPELARPADFAVFASGAYSGRAISFQIDQSGHEGTRIDVAVNSPDKPVALMLGAYEPTIWNVSWTKETKILAVLVGGYHRQAVAGLDKNVPLLVSTYDNQGPCGYFYVTAEELAPLNPLSKRVFGRPVDMVFPASEGKAMVGKPMRADAALITSSDTTPESFYDKSAPLAGPAGIADAVRKGLLRKATAADAEAWFGAVMQNSPKRDVPPVAGQGVPKPPKPPLYNAYVVLAPFTYPAGLYGANSATFLIPEGIPKPAGNPGHSSIYDFNTLKCQGGLCGTR